MAIAVLDHTLLQKIIATAGAAWHGAALRRIITRSELVSLFPDMEDWMLRLGVLHARQVPSQEQGMSLFLPSQDELRESGRHCFRAWMDQLQPPVRARVALKFPSDFERDPVPHSYNLEGPAIIRNVSGGLTGNE
jgi:hypothetical protein